MTAADVVDVLDLLAAERVDVCVDGGWGVDALLGEQTRSHADLDLAVSRDALEHAAAALAARGFAHDPAAQPGLPARLVLVDRGGRHVDLHPLEIDALGNGWQRLGERAWGLYPGEHLTGEGAVGGRPVRCITAELQLRFHLGWSWDDRAEHDLVRLAERFGTPLPPGLEAR